MLLGNLLDYILMAITCALEDNSFNFDGGFIKLFFSRSGGVEIGLFLLNGKLKV